MHGNCSTYLWVDVLLVAAECFAIKNSASPLTYKVRLVAQKVLGKFVGSTVSKRLFRLADMKLSELYCSCDTIYALYSSKGCHHCIFEWLLDEKIYIRVSGDVEARDGIVCKLRESLHGLKQAPLCWNIAIAEVLVSSGFKILHNEIGVC